MSNGDTFFDRPSDIPTTDLPGQIGGGPGFDPATQPGTGGTGGTDTFGSSQVNDPFDPGGIASGEGTQRVLADPSTRTGRAIEDFGSRIVRGLEEGATQFLAALGRAAGNALGGTRNGGNGAMVVRPPLSLGEQLRQAFGLTPQAGGQPLAARATQWLWIGLVVLLGALLLGLMMRRTA